MLSVWSRRREHEAAITSVGHGSCCSQSTRQVSRVRFISLNSFSDCLSSRREEDRRLLTCEDRIGRMIAFSLVVNCLTTSSWTGEPRSAVLSSMTAAVKDDLIRSDLRPIIAHTIPRLPNCRRIKRNSPKRKHTADSVERCIKLFLLFFKIL